MWNQLKTFFFADDVRATTERHSEKEMHMAAAGLLVSAALLDGSFDEAERARIAEISMQHFGLNREAAENLIEEASARAEKAVDFYAFARMLAKHFAPEERVQLIEMLWEVVYADGELHEFEASLLRRTAGLLHVTDRESGEARKRVLARRPVADH